MGSGASLPKERDAASTPSYRRAAKQRRPLTIAQAHGRAQGGSCPACRRRRHPRPPWLCMPYKGDVEVQVANIVDVKRTTHAFRAVSGDHKDVTPGQP